MDNEMELLHYPVFKFQWGFSLVISRKRRYSKEWGNHHLIKGNTYRVLLQGSVPVFRADHLKDD